MTVINVGLLVVSVVLVMVLRDVMGRLHGRMFGITQQQVGVVVYAYLGLFKALVIVFNLVPYLALVVMARGAV